MSEIELAGHTYRIGRMTAKEQFHVMRRLAPVLAAASETWTAVAAASTAAHDDGAPNITDIVKTAAPIISAIGALSDDHAEYVVNTCLGAVQRKQANGSWARVHAAAGLMFEDIDLPTMLQLCWHVIQENLASFFVETPSTSGSGVVALRA